MSHKIRVSTIIPTYNPNLKHLEECIRSVIYQEGIDDVEVIIIDDSTEKNISEIIKKKEFQNINLVDGPSCGVGAARSMGYKLAKYDLIAHMDGDDTSHPQRFAQQVSAIYSGADICGTNTRYIGNKYGRQTFVESDSAIRYSLAFGAFLSQPSIMVNRSTLKDDGLFDNLDICEDYESWCRLAKKGYRFCNLPMRLLNYRVHDAQATHKKKERIQNVSSRIRLDYVQNEKFSIEFRKFYLEHYQHAWLPISDRTLEDFWHISLSEGLRWGVHPQDVLRIFYAVIGRSVKVLPSLLQASLIKPRRENLWLDSEIQLKSKLSIIKKITQQVIRNYS